MKDPFILYTDAIQFAIGAVFAQVQNGIERVICYASKSLNKAQSHYSTNPPELLAIVNYTSFFKHYLFGRRFKIINDHRALRWLQNFKDLDALTARWLAKLAAFDYEIEHRSGTSIGHADCMSRLPATTTALNMTATMGVGASVFGPPNRSSQHLLFLNSHTPPTQPSHSTNILWDTVKSNQTDDEQSGVKHGHEAGANNNNQIDDKQSEIKNGNEALKNKNSQIDDEQSGVTNGRETSATKPASQFTVVEQQGD